MKKLSKFIYFIFAFALITCMAIFNPAITSVNADDETATLPKNSISISTGKISSTVEAGEDLLIPKPDVKHATSATTYTVVKDRSGKTYNYNWNDGKTYTENNAVSTVNYFTLFKTVDGQLVEVTDVATEYALVTCIQPRIIGKGTYAVQHKVVVGDRTYYSESQSVQVKGVVYSWQFNAENTAKNIIPSITNADSEYVLPLPTIINGQDERANIQYTTADIAAASGSEKHIIITKGGADVTANVTRVADGKIYFAPTLASGESSATYIIKYKSKVTAFADRTFTVKVENGYKAEAKLEVSHNSITNVQVGATTTFPTVNVTDKTHNKTNVEVNNTIIIKKGSTTKARLRPNEYTYKFEEAGTYTIYYEVEDAYGNKATSSAYSFTVSNHAPYVVAYADNYTVTDGAVVGDVVTDVDYLVHSEVGYGGFVLPAIYAKDYVTTDYSKLSFSRRLELSTDSSVYFDLDVSATVDPEHGNKAYTFDAPKYNEAIRFEFPTEEIAKKYAGCTFNLKYSAKGEGDSYAYATVYKIKVADVETLSYNVDKNLIINFPTINSAIDPNAELSFTAATAKEEPTNSSLVADERVEVRTYYYYGDKTEIEQALTAHIAEVTNSYNNDDNNTDTYNEKYGYNFDEFYGDLTLSHLTKLKSVDGKTTIKLDASQFTSQPKVTIFAVAINDQGQFIIKAQEVAINNTNEDDVPYIVNATGFHTDTIFDQNAEVTLPKVSFQDATDKSLEVEVRCYVDTPDQTVGVRINKFIQDATGNLWGVEEASLTTTYAGTYYVIYTATDDAGNKVSYVSTFDVANTEKAYIEVENGSNISKTVGEEVVFNINLAGNGDYKDVKTTITWGENKPSGLGSLPNSFKFDKAGTYVATISATYTLNGTPNIPAEPSVTVTVTITEPELKWEDGINELLTNRTANIGEKIELPVVSATENGVEINAMPKVVFIDEKGKETDVEVEFDETTFNNYYFEASKNGVYKVSYTATTDYNSESKNFTVTCGDYYDPTIVIANNKLEGSKITYNGTDITFKVDSFKQKTVDGVKQSGKYILKVSAFEDESKLFTYDIDVTLKDTDADKNTVDLVADTYSFELTGDNCTSNGSNNWSITGVGSYELKLTVKDANGNATTKAVKFTVAGKTEPKSIKDNVVGIVLIVVSAVILGGVILFFALAGKRNKTRRTSVKSNNKN